MIQTRLKAVNQTKICKNIMKAKNTEDFIAALKLLKGWEKTGQKRKYAENPNLIIKKSYKITIYIHRKNIINIKIFLV